MSLITALKVFWCVLTDKERSRRISNILQVPVEIDLESKVEENCLDLKLTNSLNVRRSDALELLVSLQREARFVDFIKENIENCDDATLAAAARMIHDRCAGVLERCFAIRTLTESVEGQVVSLTLDESKNSFRIKLTRKPNETKNSISGKIIHSGWKVTKCAIPQWSGAQEDSCVISPIELDN